MRIALIAMALAAASSAFAQDDTRRIGEFTCQVRWTFQQFAGLDCVDTGRDPADRYQSVLLRKADRYDGLLICDGSRRWCRSGQSMHFMYRGSPPPIGTDINCMLSVSMHWICYAR